MINKFFSRLPWSKRSTSSNSLIGIALFAGRVTGVRLHPGASGWLVSSKYLIDIADEQATAAAIDKVVSELTRFSCRCNLVLSPNLYQVVQMEKPALAEADLIQSLPWLSKDLCQIPPENIVADYMDSPVGNNIQAARINVFLADKSYLQPLLVPFHDKEMMLDAILPEEQATAQLLRGDEFAHLLVVQHPGQEPAIIIVKQGNVMLVRRLRGFNALRQSSDEHMLGALLENLSLEVQRSMDFYESQMKQAPIKDIQVAICGQNDEEIARRLAEFQAVKVIPLRPELPLGDVIEPDYYLALAAAWQLTGSPA